MSLPTVPTAELRRFTGSPRALLALLAVILVPLVYGGLYTWANQSPQTRLDQVTAAVVNLDEPVTLTQADGSSQLVPLGRSVVGKLTGSDSSANFHWVLTDAPDAASGLVEGRYAAVLTIPADFSRSATSTSGPPADAKAARLVVRTDDSVNYLDGAIATSIATTASAETARTITEGYLRALYAGYGTMHSSLGDAASGAGKLASGADELRAGADKAAAGAGSLAGGVDQLATGAGDLAVGATQLADGASAAAAGAAQLSAGLATLDTETSGLPAQTAALASGAAQVSTGVSQLAAGSGPLASGLAQLATGLGDLEPGAEQTSAGAASLSSGLTAYTQGIDALAASCASSGAAPAFCSQLSTLAAQGTGLTTGAQGVATGTAQVAAGLAQLTPGAQTGASAAAQLDAGLTQLTPGAAQLAGGTAQLAAGMPTLRDGIHAAATGGATLAGNMPTMADGAAEIATGAGQLAGGAGDAASGAGDLATGIESLASGTGQLSTGASDLANGLGQGAAKIPTYTESERTALAQVAATPVIAEATRANAVQDNGAGLAPYFLALALWVGSLATFMLLRPLAPRGLASSAASPLIALAGYFPAALLAVFQGVVVALVLQHGVGIGAGSTWALVGMAVLVALTFTAINQALVALLGAPGRFVAVLLAALQLTSAGGIWPVDTAPALFQWLHGALPLTYAVDGLRRIVAGVSSGVGTDVAVLLVTLVGSLLVTTYAARRQRTWTMRRLRPVVAA